MLLEHISHDLIQAQKARDVVRIAALRQAIAALKDAAIAARPQELDDAAESRVLRQLAKQRRESIEAFTQGNRPDLMERESAELAVLESYLPAQASADEIRQKAQAVITALGAASPTEFGRVMKQTMTELGGRADGQHVQQIVRELLT